MNLSSAFNSQTNPNRPWPWIFLCFLTAFVSVFQIISALVNAFALADFLRTAQENITPPYAVLLTSVPLILFAVINLFSVTLLWKFKKSGYFLFIINTALMYFVTHFLNHLAFGFGFRFNLAEVLVVLSFMGAFSFFYKKLV